MLIVGSDYFCSMSQAQALIPKYDSLKMCSLDRATHIMQAEYGVLSAFLREISANTGSALFDALRKMRGSKTLIFSSHRFGNLTRHADVIL